MILFFPGSALFPAKTLQIVLSPRSFCKTDIHKAIEEGRVFFVTVSKDTDSKLKMSKARVAAYEGNIPFLKETDHFLPYFAWDLRYFTPAFIVLGNEFIFEKRDGVLWIGQKILDAIKSDSKLSDLLKFHLEEESLKPLPAELETAVDQLRERERRKLSLAAKIKVALEEIESETMKQLIQEDNTISYEILSEIAMGVNVPSEVMRKARRFFVPLLISDRKNFRYLHEIRLMAEDVKAIDYNTLTDDSKSDLAYSLFTIAQRCPETQELLQRLLQDPDSIVRENAIESYRNFFVSGYFRDRETILMILKALNNSEIRVKSKAIKAVNDFLAVAPFYVMDAIGLNALTLKEDFRSNGEMIKTIQNLYFLKDKDFYGETVHITSETIKKAQFISISILSELGLFVDIQGNKLLSEEEIQPILDDLVEKIRQRDTNLPILLSKYTKFKTVHRIEEVIDSVEAYFPMESSPSFRASIINDLGLLKYRKGIKEQDKSRINRWLSPFIDGTFQFEKEKEVHVFTAGERELKLYLQKGQIQKIENLLPFDFALGIDITVTQNTIGGVEVSEIKCYGTGMSEGMKRIVLYAEIDGFPVEFTVEWKEEGWATPKWPSVIRGKISKIEIKRELKNKSVLYPEIFRQLSGKVRVHDSSVRKNAVIRYDYSKSYKDACILMSFLNDENENLREKAFNKLSKALFVSFPDLFPLCLQKIEELWMKETNHRVMKSMIRALVYLSYWMEKQEDREKARQLFDKLKTQYRIRTERNILVANMLEFYESRFELSSKALDSVETSMTSTFAGHIGDLKKLTEAMKLFLRKFDSEFDTVNDETLAGLSYSNVVLDSYFHLNLFGFFKVLKHEVRHRTVKGSGISYKQNELLSRIEDAISIKVHEKILSQAKDDGTRQYVGHTFKWKKYSLSTYQDEIYGPLDDEMDKVLERILETDSSRPGWNKEINAILREVEKKVGVYVPDLTEGEMNFLERLMASDQPWDLCPNPLIKDIMESAKRLVKIQLKQIEEVYSEQQVQEMTALICRSILFDLLRTHILLEEDLLARLYSPVSKNLRSKAVMDQIIKENNAGYFDSQNPTTSSALSNLFIQTACEAQGFDIETRKFLIAHGTTPLFSGGYELDPANLDRGQTSFYKVAKAVIDPVLEPSCQRRVLGQEAEHGLIAPARMGHYA